MSESNVEFFSVISRVERNARVRIENGLYLQEILNAALTYGSMQLYIIDLISSAQIPFA